MLSELVELQNLGDDETALLFGLEELLASEAFPGLDREDVDVSVAPKSGLSVRLPHVSGEYEVQVDIGPHGGLLTVGLDHLHVDRNPDRSSIGWPEDTFDYIAAIVGYTKWLLTGRIEIEERYRLLGVATKTWLVLPGHPKSLIQSGGWLVPVWKHRGEHRIIRPDYTRR